MAWFSGIQEKIPLPEEFLEIKGNLTEDEAHKWLVRYFKANIGIAARLILGIKLLPFQEIMIKGMFQRDYSMLIISRGGSKSFSVAVFVALHAVFEQGTKIALLSKTFRQSRMILQTIEEFASKPEAAIFRECMVGAPSHKNDEWSMKVGRSTIIALPLGTGDKLRGYRFKCMIIDEFLLMPQKIVEEVLMPFLSTNAEPEKRIKQKRTEDALIKQGKMREEDRMKFKNSKMICMSSASYKFEFLYKKYCDYINNIMNGFRIVKKDDGTEEKKPLDGTYFVFQIAYSALPTDLYDASVLENSKKSMSPAQFNREYGSQFTDDSSGYFSAKALNLCTYPEGSEETTELFGEPGAEYLLTIDPSSSEQETSDFFAMSVSKVLPNGKYQLVHHYGVAGGKLRHHIAYLYYILKNFNIKLIILDNAGGVTFIRAANESKLFQEAKLNIDLISNTDIKLGKTGPDEFRENITLFKKEFSSESASIKAYCIYFESDWIRFCNELLQKHVDNKSVLFSCGLDSNRSKYDHVFEALSNKKEIALLKITGDEDDDKAFGGSGAEDEEEDEKISKNVESAGARAQKMIEKQDFFILETKKQISMIEPRSTANGTITFDLAPEMKRQRGAGRPRRDLYTTTFMMTWAVEIYNAVKTAPEEEDHWGEYSGPLGWSGAE